MNRGPFRGTFSTPGSWSCQKPSLVAARCHPTKCWRRFGPPAAGLDQAWRVFSHVPRSPTCWPMWWSCHGRSTVPLAARWRTTCSLMWLGVVAIVMSHRHNKSSVAIAGTTVASWRYTYWAWTWIHRSWRLELSGTLIRSVFKSFSWAISYRLGLQRPSVLCEVLVHVGPISPLSTVNPNLKGSCDELIHSLFQ